MATSLQARLTETHAKAARLYLRRQEIEQQRQQIAHQATLCDQALVKTDGEIELLNALIAVDVTDGL